MIRSRALRLSLVLFGLFSIVTMPATSQTYGETATAAEQVWVRAEPTTESPILGELLTGDEVMLHGESENGFVSVIHGDNIGWVYSAYLILPGDSSSDVTEAPAPAETNPTEPQETPAPTTVPETPVPTEAPAEEAAPATGSMISWPVAGGEWEILQGYNGSSHQNNSDLWQYRDSLDLVRTDGSTAGQTIYSPVSGTVRWLDPATGGVSIDLGNGYSVALFHVTFYDSVTEGSTLTQGEAIGYISGPGEAGYVSTPHAHIAVWATSDGGNWNRVSVPFEGETAISGYSLPNDGTGFQHTGIVFNP